MKRLWKEWRAQRRARELIRRQLASEDWPEVRTAFARLRERGVSEREAVTRLAVVLEREVGRMLAELRCFDRDLYVAELDALL